MHAFEYRAVYDNLGQSRAVCVAGLTTLCGKTFCPKHDATAYTDHMARHATDSI